MAWIKDKERLLKAARKKGTNNIQGNSHKVPISWLFSRNSAARREWHNIFTVIKGKKNYSKRVFYKVRFLFRFAAESIKQTKAKTDTNKPALQNMLKRLL